QCHELLLAFSCRDPRSLKEKIAKYVLSISRLPWSHIAVVGTVGLSLVVHADNRHIDSQCSGRSSEQPHRLPLNREVPGRWKTVSGEVDGPLLPQADQARVSVRASLASLSC